MADNTNAPFVYFDEVLAYGCAGQVVEVELIARSLHPGTDGITIIPVCTARLRCNALAARVLINALTYALEMADRPAPQAVEAKQFN